MLTADLIYFIAFRRVLDALESRLVVINQLLQLCTARIAWSDSVIRSETSLITESDGSGPIR